MPSKRSRSCCVVGALVCLGALLSGCAHSLVYDEHRDKQGQAAVKAVEEAHLASTVESMSKAFTEMAAREEASARQRVEQLFEWEMVRVSRAKTLNAAMAESEDTDDQVDGLATTLRSRLDKLGLKDLEAATLRTLTGMPNQLRRKIVAFENKRTTFLGAYGVLFNDCISVYAASVDPSARSDVAAEALLKRIPAGNRADANAAFKPLVSDCKDIDQLMTNWSALFAKGSVKELAGELDQLARKELTYQAQKAKAAADLAAARKAAEPVIAAAKPGAEKLAAVESEAQKLLRIVAQARQVNDIAGAEVLAADKLDHLEKLLSSLAGTSSDAKVQLSEDELLTVGLVRGLPGLRDDAKKLFAEAAKPRLVPFLAAIDYQKQVIENIEAVRVVDRKYLDLRRAQLRAALEEAVALSSVLQSIETNRWGDKSVSQLNTQLSGNDKRLFYEALGTYGDGVRQARVEQAVLNSRAVAAIYERNLVNSRHAAAQWDALMDLSAKVLADYHAAGIKSADIAEFFKALGLVAIGVGVAQ